MAEGSSTDTPTFYKVTAMWATQDGSLLLWALLLSIFSSAVLFLTRRSLREIAPWATAVLGVVAALLPAADGGVGEPVHHAGQRRRAEGAGLNPLLRHPAMMIHPPMLYTGYVGFSIPFAFAIGALITRHTGRRLDPRHAPLRAGGLDLPRHRHPARRAVVLHRARAGAATGPGTRWRTPR